MRYLLLITAATFIAGVAAAGIRLSDQGVDMHSNSISVSGALMFSDEASAPAEPGATVYEEDGVTIAYEEDGVTVWTEEG